MKILELKRSIDNVPDDYDVIMPGRDHSYFYITIAKVGTALFSGNCISEDFGEALTPEGEYGERKKAFIIS